MWTFKRRRMALNVAKWILAYAIVLLVGYQLGMYVTHDDLVTAWPAMTVAMYAMLGFIVRMVMK